MKVTLLLVALLAPQDSLPGTDYSRPAPGVVLRSGPGVDFWGVMSFDGDNVVRLGEQRGVYREVFVPQGIPVYMHADLLEIKEEQAEAWVRRDRVNMRLFPSIEGNLPIGQLPVDTGPLIVLGREGEWVRLLAPVDVPLFVADDAVTATDPQDAAEDWRRALATRADRQVAAVAAWRVQHPEWDHQNALLREVTGLAAEDLSRYDDDQLRARRLRLDGIRGETTWDATLAEVNAIDARIEELLAVRKQVATSLHEVRKQETRAAVDISRESRILGLGLRYTGRGDPMTRNGTIRRLLGVNGAEILSLETTDGELYKLTGAPRSLKLATWVGRRVQLTGRKVYLNTVAGPVLVVDEVAAAPR